MRIQKYHYSFCSYLTLFAIAVLLLYVRNPDPVLNPIIYAEDGTWTAHGLREGWILL